MPPKLEKVILTKHARQRMRSRRISEEAIRKTVQRPDTRSAETDGDTKFTKQYFDRDYHVVAHPLPDQNAWLVKTVWVRGEEDPLPLWRRLLKGLLSALLRR